MFFGYVDKFLRRKAFLVMVSMWAFQDSVLLIYILCDLIGMHDMCYLIFYVYV